MAEIDHLVYVVPDLDASIARFVEALGVRPEVGGRHAGLGTWNALVALDADHPCYLELIAADPDQAAPGQPRPFGVDADPGPRLATFAIRPSDGETIESLAATLAAHGLDPGPAVPAARTTPRGDELRWRLTFPVDTGDGFVPFLIDWGMTPNPAGTIGARARLDRFEAAPGVAVRPLLEVLRLPGLQIGGGGPHLRATLSVDDRSIEL